MAYLSSMCSCDTVYGYRLQDEERWRASFKLGWAKYCCIHMLPMYVAKKIGLELVPIVLVLLKPDT